MKPATENFGLQHRIRLIGHENILYGAVDVPPEYIARFKLAMGRSMSNQETHYAACVLPHKHCGWCDSHQLPRVICGCTHPEYSTAFKDRTSHYVGFDYCR